MDKRKRKAKAYALIAALLIGTVALILPVPIWKVLLMVAGVGLFIGVHLSTE